MLSSGQSVLRTLMIMAKHLCYSCDFIANICYPIILKIVPEQTISYIAMDVTHRVSYGYINFH